MVGGFCFFFFSLPIFLSSPLQLQKKSTYLRPTFPRWGLRELLVEFGGLYCEGFDARVLMELRESNLVNKRIGGGGGGEFVGAGFASV